jgi:hypothetical protein
MAFSIKESIGEMGNDKELDASKDPGPEGPALVHPRGVILVSTFASCVQVSGVRFQVSATEFDPVSRSRT